MSAATQSAAIQGKLICDPIKGVVALFFFWGLPFIFVVVVSHSVAKPQLFAENDRALTADETFAVWDKDVISVRGNFDVFSAHDSSRLN